jgi:hypothetical protein
MVDQNVIQKYDTDNEEEWSTRDSQNGHAFKICS